jgi:beta-aspartyl-peptidase (threonine type)
MLNVSPRTGIALCREQDLTVGQQRDRWREEHGTVGCVALDATGRLAAATSIGGLPGARPGRVSDSAVIGSGSYANHAAAASCTGDGEAIFRVVLARVVVGLIEEGYPPTIGVEHAIRALENQTHCQAGLITLDVAGRFGYASNAAFMPVAWIAGDGRPRAAL